MKKLLTIITIAFIFVGCKKEDAKPTMISYRYEVTGTSGSYSVTLQNAENNTQQWSNAEEGFWYKWEQSGTRWLYLSAQNNKSSGNVTVKIYKNNAVVAQNTSYGGFSIATVSGNY